MSETLASTDPLLAGLNEKQLTAVTHGDGPLLVLAGAGSGKTRVLTHRIAWLVLRAGVNPREILALTFTNKAAREMEERVEKLLGPTGYGVWLGTFHGIALRILRRHSELLPVGPGFAVYDTDDQKRLGRKIIEELNLDPKKNSVTALISTVGREKDEGRGAEEALPGRFDKWAETFRAFYTAYQRKLEAARALDFGDLLVGVLRLFTEHPEVADSYSRRFRHVLIDEYQDTNRVQYLIARRIAEGWGNLAVVGDDDQSIYGWRGADISNILDFSGRFPGTEVVKLEQNYRSTSLILDAAGSVIRQNVGRMEKTLWTDKEGGEPVRLFDAATEEEEASWITLRLKELISSGESPSSVAVLYRAHALSRPIEEAFLRASIPYAVYGGQRFYERREIKDVLAYLRLAVNPSDPVALFRVINTPPRGIGEKTLELISEESAASSIPLWNAVKKVVEENAVGPRAGRALAGFINLVEGWTADAPKLSVAELIERVLKETGYREELEKDKEGKGVDRLENIVELLSAAKTHDETENSNLGTFLDRAALVTDLDRQERGVEAVTLMTVHSAKGLEFPTVVLAGMEEGVFPHALSSGSEDEVEEERRLCYVAMTRAGKRLFITRSRMRRVYGEMSEARKPSRFLSELPEQLRPKAFPARDFSFQNPFPQPKFQRPGAVKPVAEPALAPRSTGGSYYLPDPEEASYKKGMKVRHARYGEGKITEVSGQGPRAKLSVAFLDGSVRKFIAGPAELEIRLGS